MRRKGLHPWLVPGVLALAALIIVSDMILPIWVAAAVVVGTFFTTKSAEGPVKRFVRRF